MDIEMKGENERRIAAAVARYIFMVLMMTYVVRYAEATPPMKTPTNFRAEHRNAYATMMYMGTPRDYEFYVATRVMLRSLYELGVDADLIVIASLDVPDRWVQTL